MNVILLASGLSLVVNLDALISHSFSCGSSVIEVHPGVSNKHYIYVRYAASAASKYSDQRKSEDSFLPSDLDMCWELTSFLKRKLHIFHKTFFTRLPFLKKRLETNLFLKSFWGHKRASFLSNWRPPHRQILRIMYYVIMSARNSQTSYWNFNLLWFPFWLKLESGIVLNKLLFTCF